MVARTFQEIKDEIGEMLKVLFDLYQPDDIQLMNYTIQMLTKNRCEGDANE